MKKVILISIMFAMGNIAKGQSCLNRGAAEWTNMDSCDAPTPIVYPNPASDILNFRFDDSLQGDIRVKIYDLMGTVSYHQKFSAVPQLISFQIGNLPSGLYFYEIKTNDAIIRDKFEKQ
jgi:hypothetical protein